MKPAAFDYLRIDCLEHALEMLEESGEGARILAGGQSLLPILNMRLLEAELLLDISRTPDLKHLGISQGYLVVGAGVTQGELEWRGSLSEEVPLLAQALPSIAHFQIRNRGTVCGSIAHADPSAELPLVLSALDGEVVLASTREKRVLKARDFFQGMLTTARAPNELIEAVRFPLRSATSRYGFAEFSTRHGDYALVACAAVTRPDEIRLAVGGVADRPVVSVWPRLTDDALKTAINDLSWELDAQDEPEISAAYRRHLVRVLALEAIEGGI
ncbi:MAG: FAD binding domain-containing protein [Burkholderiaceae bacterium]